jgi:hypothetical protein
MPSSKAEKLRKAYEFKLGKSLVSKLSDDQINLLSKFYNSLSESEQSDIDNKIFKGHTDTDLHEMAEAFYQEQVENKESKETPKETPTKSSAIVPSNFFGKDRYEKYLEEINAQGTIEGHKLTSQERKDAFKSRKNKINFQTFVDRVLEKKVATASVQKNSAAFSLGGSGALVTTNNNIINSKNFTQNLMGEGGNFEEISKKIDEIIESLKDSEKLKEKREKLNKRNQERERRSKQESKLESGFKKVKKAVQKVIAPVKGILDKIFGFLFNVFLGRFFIKLLDWFGDPKNQSKINAIGRFLGENWPKLLALYIAFGTSFGKFVRGLLRLVIRSTVKLVAVTAKLLAKATAGKIGGKLSRFLGRNSKGLSTALEVGTMAIGTLALSQGIEDFGGIDQETQGFSGGGFAFPKFKMSPKSNMFGKAKSKPQEVYNSDIDGGYVSGEKGIDKIPAMLSDGEFVMSEGAVRKYGVDVLESMNAAGGGTNRPKMMNNVTYAAGGGSIGSGEDLLHPRAKTIFNLLVDGGMSPVAAGGIVANIGTETGYTYDPTTKQGGGGPGRGLAQWEKGGRYDTDNINLKDYAKSQNKSWEDLTTQVNFILHEMMHHPEYVQVKKRMNKAQDINEATRIFLLDYEKAGTPHMDRRLKVAKQIQGSDWFKSKGKSWLEKKFKSQFFPKFFSGGLVEGKHVNIAGGNTGNRPTGSKSTPSGAVRDHYNMKWDPHMKIWAPNIRKASGTNSLQQAREADNPYNIRWPRDYYPGKKAPPGPGHVPVKLASNTRSQKGLPSIAPPMSSNVEIAYVPIGGNASQMGSSGYVGSDIPTFSASTSGISSKKETLGISV